MYSFQPLSSSHFWKASIASTAAANHSGEENEQCAGVPAASRHSASGCCASHHTGISSISRGSMNASPGALPQVARRKSSSAQEKSYLPGAVMNPGRKGRMPLLGLIPRSPA